MATAHHIVILLRDFGLGGGGRTALRLAREWKRHGRRVTILSGTLSGPLLGFVPAGVHIHRLDRTIPRSSLSRRRFFRALPFTIYRLEPDILFLPDRAHLMLGGTVRYLPRPPKVVGYMTGSPGPYALLRRPIERFYGRALREIDVLVAGSSRLSQSAWRLGGKQDAGITIECKTAFAVPDTAAASHGIDPATQFLELFDRLINIERDADNPAATRSEAAEPVPQPSEERQYPSAKRRSSWPTSLSVFDLDRTLTILPTYSRFLLFAARSHAPWRLLLLPLLLPAALLYAANLIPRRSMKQIMHRIALGDSLPEQAATRLADRFATQLVDHGLYAEGLALIEAERTAGRRIVLATAAPHFYTAALARRLGIDDVVASASSWKDGRLTPAIGSANCYGADKRFMVEDFLHRAGITRAAAHIRFYSDHASDLPMFELADEAIAVNPSAKLLEIASARGWPVLDWRP